jgi:acetolactate synthase-1/2/3 large subunit
MFGPVTKFSARVDSVERFPDLLRQAFRVATTGSPGPVHLELPGEQGQGIDRPAELEVIIEETFSRVPPFRPEAELPRVRVRSLLKPETTKKRRRVATP